MLIRHKITFWFIGLSGMLLCCFSAYIYLASANSRRSLFVDRIKAKALATKEIYEEHDKIAERIITSIPEQSEYVFDENEHLIFAINDLGDFRFTHDFFKNLQKNGEYEFRYQQASRRNYKEGYAFQFLQGEEKRVIAITAFDKNGLQQLSDLSSIILLGNLFFLAALGASAYFLSTRAFRPIKDLVRQSESVQGNDFGFRLTYTNPKDEIGIVASSFNKVLDKIQAVAESQKSFISYASHELRTPLAAVNGILETSLKYDNEAVDMKDSMTAARKEIQKATGLVNSLLQLAKIESVDTLFEMTRLNIVDVLLDAISYFKLKIPGQEFLFIVSDKLPKDVSLEINGHAQLLKIAFINLIDNASKYSKQEKVEVRLDILSPGEILIEVADRGIGILPADIVHLSDPFYRGENAQTFDGFGLGLSLTRKILTLHKGSFTLNKNEFSGVTAKVILPIPAS